MQKIPISQAKSGMALAKDLFRPESSGAVPVCGKGTVLTETLLERLAGMNVQSVTVQGHPVMVDGEETLEERFLKLEARFRHLVDDPLMMRIKESYKRQITRMMES